MEIFKQLNKLGYKHHVDLTIEQLDKLPINNIERRIECSLIIDWFRERYNWLIVVDVANSTEYYAAIREFDEDGCIISKIPYKNYPTYYKAREQAILKAIELCQKK